MATAFRWHLQTNLAYFGPYALCAMLSGCVEDVSSLTGGLPASGSAGNAGTGGAPSATGGAPPGDAGQSASASEPDGLGGLADMAGAGGSSAGSAGDAATCLSKGLEICNGADDDCDGVVDNGCPSSLVWTLHMDRPELGDSRGGSPFGDQCEAGEVLTGIEAGFGFWLDQIRGVCSSFSVEADATKTPYDYRIALTGARVLPPHPQMGTSTAALTCPPNQALIGLRISEQTSGVAPNTWIMIPKLWLSCAELALKKDDMGNYSVSWQGPLQIGPLSGPSANDSAWFAEDASPSTEVPVRLTGSAGEWVDRVGFATGTLLVVLR